MSSTTRRVLFGLLLTVFVLPSAASADWNLNGIRVDPGTGSSMNVLFSVADG